jgi:hypothetical protein
MQVRNNHSRCQIPYASPYGGLGNDAAAAAAAEETNRVILEPALSAD